jgi:hypothetical protein
VTHLDEASKEPGAVRQSIDVRKTAIGPSDPKGLSVEGGVWRRPCTSPPAMIHTSLVWFIDGRAQLRMLTQRFVIRAILAILAIVGVLALLFGQ